MATIQMRYMVYGVLQGQDGALVKRNRDMSLCQGRQAKPKGLVSRCHSAINLEVYLFGRTCQEIN